MSEWSVREQLTQSNFFHDTSYWYRRLGLCIYDGYASYKTLSGFDKALSPFALLFDSKVKGKYLPRKSLQLPKTVSEYIVKNAYSEMPKPNLVGEKILNEDNEEVDNVERNDVLSLELVKVNEILTNNNYWTREKESFEVQIPLGDRVVKPYVQDRKIKIDFITGDRFIATKVENGEIISGIVLTTKRVVEKKKTWYYTRVEWHYELSEMLTLDEANKGAIAKGRGIKVEVYRTLDTTNYFKNRCGNWQNDLYNYFGELKDKQIEEYPDLEVPTFVFMKNPIKNNKDIHSARGLGIFMNQLSAIQSGDEAFHAKGTDIVYGQMKLGIPEQALEEVQDGEGNPHNHYNPNDPEIFVYPDTVGNKPEVMAPTLRIQDQVLSLNTDLDIVSVGLGLTAGTLRFDGKSIVTATQFISEKSESAKTIRMHEDNNTVGFIKLLMLIKFYSEKFTSDKFTYETDEVQLKWFDNIRVDDETIRREQQTLVEKGYKSREEYLVEQEGKTPTEAKESVLKAVQEQAMIASIMNEVQFGSNDDLDNSNPDGTLTPQEDESEDDFIERFTNDEEMQSNFGDDIKTTAQEQWDNGKV